MANLYLSLCVSHGFPIFKFFQWDWASLVAQLVKNPPAMQETWVQSLGWEDPLEEGKATHSSILAWRIPWTVQSMGLQRVGHDWVTFTFNNLSGDTNEIHLIYIMKYVNVQKICIDQWINIFQMANAWCQRIIYGYSKIHAKCKTDQQIWIE